MISNSRFNHSLAQAAGDVTRMREFSHLTPFVVESVLSDVKEYESRDLYFSRMTKTVEFFEKDGELVVRFDIENTTALLIRKKGIACSGCSKWVHQDITWRRRHNAYNNVLRSREWRDLLGKDNKRFLLTPALCQECHTSFMGFVRKHRIKKPENHREIITLYTPAANEWLANLVRKSAA